MATGQAAFRLALAMHHRQAEACSNPPPGRRADHL